MAYLLKKIFLNRTDGLTDGRFDFIMPQILFEGIKIEPYLFFILFQEAVVSWGGNQHTRHGQRSS